MNKIINIRAKWIPLLIHPVSASVFFQKTFLVFLTAAQHSLIKLYRSKTLKINNWIHVCSLFNIMTLNLSLLQMPPIRLAQIGHQHANSSFIGMYGHLSSRLNDHRFHCSCFVKNSSIESLILPVSNAHVMNFRRYTVQNVMIVFWRSGQKMYTYSHQVHLLRVILESCCPWPGWFNPIITAT